MPKRIDDTEVLLWCLRPAVDLCHLRGPLPDKISALPITERPFRPATHSHFRDFLVATETVNQARAVDPLTASAAAPIDVTAPSAERRDRVLTTRAVDRARKRVAATLAGRVPPAVVASFDNQLLKVALAVDQYREMSLGQYAGVLVSSQHSPIMRALIAAAREQGVPVVYVPHAPVAGNNAYADLPVAYAGLRGSGEVDHYHADLGVPTARLGVVGNLANDTLVAPLPDVDPSAPGVLALSPHPLETIRRIFAVVGEAGLGEMVVAPHPRSDLAEVRSCLPAGWSIFEDGRTLDLLAGGAPFLFQYSSGVAWEAAALGVPTATVHIDDAPVNYPFLEDESVYPAIRQQRDAATFAAAARAGRIDRQALRAHAERWCSVDGAVAAERLSALLDRVAAQGTDAGMLHDGWGPGGVALTRSWIATTPAAPKRRWRTR